MTVANRQSTVSELVKTLTNVRWWSSRRGATMSLG